MKRFLGLAIGIVALSGAVAAAQGAVTGTAQAGQPPAMTNLQIFPKDTPRPQVLATMQAFTQSLGVQCNYCHVQEGRGGRNDMASDEKPTKKAARGMMLLAREINAKLPEAVGKGADATTRVGCATCHRGVPDSEADHRHRHRRRKRDARGLAKYKELRDKFYGGQSYDFSEGSLIVIAQRANTGEQAGRRARLPEREPRVLPEVGRGPTRRWRQMKSAKGRQGRRDRGAREGGRARPEQRAGEGAPRRT